MNNYVTNNERLGLYGTKPWKAAFPIYVQYSGFTATEKVQALQEERSTREKRLADVNQRIADMKSDPKAYGYNPYDVSRWANILAGLIAESENITRRISEIDQEIKFIQDSGAYSKQAEAETETAKTNRQRATGAVAVIALLILAGSIWGITKAKTA